MKRTPYIRLVIAAMLGIGTSVAPLVLLMFGIIQFNIIRLVGQDSVTQIFGIAAGVASLAIVFLSPMGGYIADHTYVKMGRRRFWILTGSIVACCFMFLFSRATNMIELTIYWILAQLFYGLVSTCCYSIVPEQVDQEKFGRVSGLIGAATPVFVMLGSAVVMGTFAESSISSKVMMIALAQVVCGIIATLLIQEEPSIKPDRLSEQTNDRQNKALDKKYIYPSIRRYPEYTWALLTKLFINLTNAGMTMLTLFYIARFHLDETHIFKLNALMSIGIGLMVVSGLLGGFLSDKVKKQKPFVMGSAFITGICMIAFAFSHDITLVIIANFIFNFGFGMYNAVDVALINRILPSKENYAKDISIMNVTTQISSSLVNFIAPSIIALGVYLLHDDGYTFFFLVLALFSIASAVCVSPIPEAGRPLRTPRSLLHTQEINDFEQKENLEIRETILSENNKTA